MIYAITLILLVLSTGLQPTASVACDATLTDLFAPRPGLGRYEVCVSADQLDAARPEGMKYGEIERLEPLDAFGRAGGYDRSKLVRLYGGRRVAVVRGWRQDAGRFASVTLLSPYPDAALTHLEPGTMIIRWTADVPGIDR
jgi:hypothetical protein